MLEKFGFRVAFCLTIIWILIAVALLIQSCSALDCMDPNEWGDYFAGVFAPAAFFWLLMTVQMQRNEFSENKTQRASELRAYCHLAEVELHGDIITFKVNNLGQTPAFNVEAFTCLCRTEDGKQLSNYTPHLFGIVDRDEKIDGAVGLSGHLEAFAKDHVRAEVLLSFDDIYHVSRTRSCQFYLPPMEKRRSDDAGRRLHIVSGSNREYVGRKKLDG